MLWFAAVGPLMAAATFVDAARTGRRDRRRAEADAAAARVRISAAVDRRHADERAALRSRHPDAAGLLAAGPDGHDGVWRRSRGAVEALVVGHGDVPSTVRVSGGWEPADLEVKRRAATLADAPVTVPLLDGIAVVGPQVCAAAVVRALAVQLVLAAPPGVLRMVGSSAGEAAWSRDLPHRMARDGIALALCGPGDAAPDADIAIARVAPGAPPPPFCSAVLTLTAIDRGTLVHDGETHEVVVEGMGREQAFALAAALAGRAAVVFRPVHSAAPEQLAPLLEEAPTPHPHGLPAVVGTVDGAAFVLDLVADGPHAVVAGMTGAGKSELLTTWVTSLCATHSTDDVVFLLADFKGGTAFEALSGLPHVTGVVTDLDGGGALRALESLRAELRRREAELVRAGARDIADPAVRLPRLVVVVDEFAALAAAHPEITGLITDIAARGRALGMHLVLGTQRAAGVLREALTANCPLRISLRVADAADSRAVVGTEDAARLSGDADAVGIAIVRRAADAVPRAVRIALTSPATIAAATAGAAGSAPRRPWLPELPVRLELDELSVRASRRRAAGEIVLGLADEPELQRQRIVTLRPSERGLAVVGRPGSGRTSVLATVAAQATHTLLGADPEAAWDALAALVATPPADGHVLLVDDLDGLLAGLPPEYAHAVIERLETLLRHAGGDGGPRVVLATQRLSGGVARLFDLLPRRAVLATSSRAEHVAVGGDPGCHRERVPPGRGSLDARVVQFAAPPRGAVPDVADRAPRWKPADGVTGVVVRGGAAVRRFRERARDAGALVRGIEEAPDVLDRASAGVDTAGARPPVVIVADAEEWQRSWRALAAVRAEHELLIDADCAGEYRLLSGDRELPPYCTPGRGRAWLLSRDGTLRRVRTGIDR